MLKMCYLRVEKFIIYGFINCNLSQAMHSIIMTFMCGKIKLTFLHLNFAEPKSLVLFKCFYVSVCSGFDVVSTCFTSGR